MKKDIKGDFFVLGTTNMRICAFKPKKVALVGKKLTKY